MRQLKPPDSELADVPALRNGYTSIGRCICRSRLIHCSLVLLDIEGTIWRTSVRRTELTVLLFG